MTERQRRPIKRLQAQLVADADFAAAITQAKRSGGTDSLTDEEEMRIAAGMGSAFDTLENLNDSLIVALVAGWSYGHPVTLDGVQDIPGHDLDALRKECAPLMRQLMPDFEPTPDPESPIGPSTA
ncbi:hypothetical protein [Actinacidiphila acididurans]|uniref:Phage gp6-like head-tail connector protein n=1 Tax=Actinacidiphila acididurans TaxID=2784346 RepID=A0ABS2TPT3_9ACTN|nr:hypothetical protein [Actinacidiphila acididurans]MBM9504521.1 hypothetical protein [Actinacidiphila acididurans]